MARHARPWFVPSRIALGGALLALVVASLVASRPAHARSAEDLDQLFSRVAELAPEFGGAYYEESGALAIVVQPERGRITAAQMSRTLDALVTVFGKTVLEPIPSPARVQPGIGTVVYVAGRYRFADLHGWSRRLLPVFRKGGLRFSDIDERRNRLVVGITAGASVADVLSLLAGAGIPQDSVVVEESETLHDYYSGSIIGSQQRPVLSGIELGTQAGGRCTIGLQAWFPVGWWEQRGFITAGHCGKSGGVSADEFTQPDGGDVIAHEHFNPHFVSMPGCPESFLCRRSDATAVLYDDGVDVSNHARVIRTRDWDADPNVDTERQTISIKEERPALVGDTVHKIGVGNGWTIGEVTRTCANQPKPGHAEEFMFLSQTEVQSLDATDIACRGDSGAPVFFWDGGDTSHAVMAGILWGGFGAACTGRYVFSPMSGIRADLGYLDADY